MMVMGEDGDSGEDGDGRLPLADLPVCVESLSQRQAGWSNGFAWNPLPAEAPTVPARRSRFSFPQGSPSL